jgi:signal transduction histidine kinase
MSRPFASALAVQASSAAATRARILLVDDDERNLLALSEVLEPIADIVTATSGRAALRELLKDEFAVILLDVFMPEMDGYETAALIRQRMQTARTPVIFVSAVNKETEHLMRGYAMGAVDYVFKPVDPVILKSKVAVFVDLFDLRQQIADQAMAEQELREATLRAERERLVYERQLQQAQMRQAAILEALPLAMYEATLSERGKLVRNFVGGDLQKIVGDDAEPLAVGDLHWDDRINSEDAVKLERRMSGCSDAALASQYRWSRSDGTTIYIVDQCVRSPDSAGTWVGTLIDVTAQRELEQQLVQSRKSEALGQLTGGVAHDFNNLLAAVLGGLRILDARVKFGEKERQIIDQMHYAAESGAELVRRLMAFARKQELSPTSIDPATLRDAVAGLVEHTLGANVEVEWEVADDGLQLYADKAQLELSLVNLLINARDAMPEGGKIHVAIETIGDREREQLSASSSQFLRIRVRDAGSGIPPELIERVTEPFFTTKEVGKGTGLGLSMVAGFVQQSGGAIRIDSRPSEGTRIDLFLPAAEKRECTTAPSSETCGEGLLAASVLLVDDEASIRLILSEQLRELGICVTLADDAEQALLLLEQGDRPELILTDLSMPGMDGLNLLEIVADKWPGIRGVIMTGNPKENVKRREENVAVIHKPIALDELTRVLTIAAGRGRTGRTDAA